MMDMALNASTSLPVLLLLLMMMMMTTTKMNDDDKFHSVFIIYFNVSEMCHPRCVCVNK